MTEQHTPSFGGTGGDAFDDTLLAPSRIVRLLALTIRSGTYMDSLQATYLMENGQVWAAPTHGGGGGNSNTISFSENQHITTMLLHTGGLVDQMTLITSRNGNPDHVFGPYGGAGGSPHYITGNIVGLYGRCGSYIDALGVYGQNLAWGATSLSRSELAREELSLEPARAA